MRFSAVLFVVLIFLTPGLRAETLSSAVLSGLSKFQQHGQKRTLVMVGDPIDRDTTVEETLKSLRLYADGRPLGREAFDLRYGSDPHPEKSLAPNSMSDPFILTHPYQTEYVYVYLHGITDSAYQGKDIARSLYLEGHNVLSARLSGHGIDSANINNIELADWRADVDNAIRQARPLGRKVILIGLSTGAALAIDKASRSPNEIAGIIPEAPAIGIADLKVRVLGKLRALRALSYFMPFTGSPNTTQVEVRQLRKGVHSIDVLYQLGKAIQERIENQETLAVPTLLITTEKDTMIQKSWIPRLFGLISKGKWLHITEAGAPIHSGMVSDPKYVVESVYPDMEQAAGRTEALPYGALDEVNQFFEHGMRQVTRFTAELSTESSERRSCHGNL